MKKLKANLFLCVLLFSLIAILPQKAVAQATNPTVKILDVVSSTVNTVTGKTENVVMPGQKVIHIYGPTDSATDTTAESGKFPVFAQDSVKLKVNLAAASVSGTAKIRLIRLYGSFNNGSAGTLLDTLKASYTDEAKVEVNLTYYAPLYPYYYVEVIWDSTTPDDGTYFVDIYTNFNPTIDPWLKE